MRNVNWAALNVNDGWLLFATFCIVSVAVTAIWVHGNLMHSRFVLDVTGDLKAKKAMKKLENEENQLMSSEIIIKDKHIDVIGQFL